MARLLNDTKEIKEQLILFNYHQRMDTIDVSKYFPLMCDDDINMFMKEDDELNQRKKASLYS